MEDYNIHLNDYVETVGGDIGYVTDFISEVDIVIYNVTFGPNKGKNNVQWPMYRASEHFKRIEQYTFNTFNQDKSKKPKKIESLDSLTMNLIGNGCYVEIKNENGTRGYINLVQFRDKINEIIAYINSKEA